jgi:hypothetical protein
VLRIFRGKETHVVAHPYPAPVPALRASMRELL